MNSYRIDYTEIKPGGHEDRQSVVLKGTRSDVVRYLAQTGNVKTGTVEVREFAESDSYGTSLGSLGF